MRRDGALLLSCAGGSVQGWEVYALRRRLSEGEVRSARVLFLDEAVARDQARPLLDAGATVAFYDEDGNEAVIDAAAFSQGP
jgi:hypothetical protein